MITVRAGLVYFALVFATGVLVGLGRDLAIAPQVGARLAELIEYPLLFLAIMGSASWTIRGRSRPII